MLSNPTESVFLARSQEPLPHVIVDAQAPGSLEAAVQGALATAGLCQGMVAVVLVPLTGKTASLPTRISLLGASEPGDGLVIDTVAHEVLVHGRPLPLTVREFALLHYLNERRGTLVSREQLLREVWGERYTGGPRTVDIHIRRLRAKLGAEWFETTRGIGYKFRRDRKGALSVPAPEP